MGKHKKKSKLNVCVNQKKIVHQADAAPQNMVEIDLNVQPEKYDISNPLVLPSVSQKSKKDEKISDKKEQKKKPLTKKQKRRLAKILERKQKKITRSEILNKLQTVQASQDELNLMTSTSFMQTHGLKRSIPSNESQNSSSKISNIKGSNKAATTPESKKMKMDPNVVGYNTSSEDDVSDDSGEDNDETTPNDVNVSMNTDPPPSDEANVDVVSVIPSESAESQQVDKVDPKTDSVPKVAVPCKPAVFIPVHRTPEIQALRKELPIYSEEQAIMEAIKENAVVVIHGATGSGKTTQVPQFLYEAGYTQNKMLIGITEPRRIAAIQMALRVGVEMNLPEAVSYHIRYEKTASEDKTEIKFMTDGVLLKEIRHDFLLSKYSVIIIDEAHERSIFSDVLIGLLSRILPLREKKGNPLKLIIMSATLCVEDFTENRRLFKEKPFLIKLDSRQFDVVIHFNMKTPADYLQAAYEKVAKIHRQLPAGAILVFVTGEKEVTKLCKMLKKSFPLKAKTEVLGNDGEVPIEKGTTAEELNKKTVLPSNNLPPKIDLDDYSIEPLDNEEVQHQNSDDEWNDNSDDDDDNNDNNTPGKLLKLVEGSCEPLHVLPLFSVLPTEEQSKIFQPPPPGSRLCVVSTNVAETSVTIPGLKYVVDTGKVKTRVYDKIACGVSNFAITWTSKASSNQRAGRAGRTEGGHCYRLYSSAVFENDLPEFTVPDIERIPVDDILLQMKAMGVDRVVNFPFPTSPDTECLKAAEKRLVLLGALQDLKIGGRYKDITKWEYSAKVTPLGKAMSRFPLTPRFAKMLLLSYKHQVIPYVIAIVSAMTVPEVFLMTASSSEENPDEDATNLVLYNGIKKIGTGQGKGLMLGDPMVLLRAVALYEEARSPMHFCAKFKIRMKAMVEIHKMRLQLTREMNRSFRDLKLPLKLKLDPPSDDVIQKLRKILTSSLTDHIAKKMTNEQLQNSEIRVPGAYMCLDLEEPVYLHPSSVLSKKLPEYVAYQDIFQTSKYFMRVVTEIEPEWLTAFAPDQCTFSEPLENPAPYYDAKEDRIQCSMTSTFGHRQWQLPCVVMAMPSSLARYTWFCYFLLDGQVCPMLHPFKQFLISPANVMLKQWARLLPRTHSFLQAVINRGIDSVESLHEVWEESPSYLLSEYCEWLPQSKHMDVSCIWPPKKAD